MYSIYIAQRDSSNATTGLTDWVALHHPNLFEFGNVCITPILTEAVNSSGNLSFQVAPTNPLYSELHSRNTYVCVKKNSNEIWRGRVVDISRGLNNVRKVYCEGILTTLSDTVQQPRRYRGTVAGLLTAVVNTHNSAAEKPKRFTVGTVTVGQIKKDGETYQQEIDVVTDKALDTWSFIQKNLVKTYGGYISVRKVENTFYLDYKAELDGESSQTVKFGENLINFEESLDTSEIATVVIPYGSKKDKPPVLYKQRASSGSNRYIFDRVTGDVVAGKYLFVANGAAMNTTHINVTEKLSSTLLGFNEATFDNAAGTIKLTAAGLAAVTLWTLATATTPAATSVSLSGGGTTITSQDGTTDVEIKGVAGGRSTQSVLAGTEVTTETTASTATVSTTANDAWTIKAGNYFLIGSGTVGSSAPLTYSNASFSALGRRACWQIACNEIGATITNTYNSDKEANAVIHGDVDNGWCFASSAKGDNAVENLGFWDGNRVTVKADTEGSLNVTSEDGIAIWGYLFTTKVFDVETPFELYPVAKQWIEDQVAQKTTITISAVDLSDLDPTIDSINIGDKTLIHSSPHSLNIQLYCTQKKTYLTKPDSSSVTFGAVVKTISGMIGD